MVCKACGATISDYADFCPKCKITITEADKALAQQERKAVAEQPAPVHQVAEQATIAEQPAPVQQVAEQATVAEQPAPVQQVAETAQDKSKFEPEQHTHLVSGGQIPIQQVQNSTQQQVQYYGQQSQQQSTVGTGTIPTFHATMTEADRSPNSVTATAVGNSPTAVTQQWGQPVKQPFCSQQPSDTLEQTKK